MSKAEERGKTYAIHKASEKLHDYYGNAMLSVVQFDGHDIKNAYIEGYHQAEKDIKAELSKLFQEFSLDCIGDNKDIVILHFMDVFKNKLKEIGNMDNHK